MKLIAHRGLIKGPFRELENDPSQILLSLREGYDAEIDVWYEKGQWFLGHDNPWYEIEENFIGIENLWIHCKNLGALHQLSWNPKRYNYPNYFWHQEDDYTVTSHGYIWTHVDSQETTDRSIIMADASEFDEIWWPTSKLKASYGICSKWVEKLKERLK